jgi:RNA polymerase sigma factor (sigma-70 family)
VLPIHDQTDDAALVAAVRAGDADAFAEIVRRYRAPLVTYARRLLAGSGQDPEDIVHDALIRTHASLRTAERPVQLRPWLYTVVRNRAIDVRRAHASHVVALPDALPADGADAHATVVTRERLDRTVAAVVALPERQRRALVGHAVGGRSHAALAGELGTTPRAVKSLVHRARSAVHAAAA